MGLRIKVLDPETRRVVEESIPIVDELTALSQLQWVMLNPGQIIIFEDKPSAVLENSTNFNSDGSVDMEVAIKPLSEAEIKEVEHRQQMMFKQMQAASSGLVLPGQTPTPMDPTQAELLRRMHG